MSERAQWFTPSLGRFRFDHGRLALEHDGRALSLSTRAAGLLSHLLQHRGRVLTKEELLEAVWPGQAVEESNLTVQIAALRRVLDSRGEGTQWIVTVPRHGYRFADLRRGELERPSVAVLGFVSLGGDDNQAHLAIGLCEDLLTDLSRLDGLRVIARASSFSAHLAGLTLAEISQALGARFLVQGSVRSAEGKVRINFHVSDALDGTQLWADRIDGAAEDVFDLQDRAARSIIGALSSVLPVAQVPRRRQQTSLEAYEYYSKGRMLVLQSPDGFRRGHPMLLRAAEIDPEFGEAHAWIAMSNVCAWLYWGLPQDGQMELAVDHARRAIELDRENADAHAFLGYVTAFRGELDPGIAEVRLAISLNENHADAHILLAELLVHEGDSEDALEEAERAFLLNPLPPAWYFWIQGFVLFACGKYEAAAAMLSSRETRQTGSDRILAASLAMLGRVDEARKVGQDFLRTVPSFTIMSWSQTHKLRRPEVLQRFAERYRRAGLPE